ncbi:MAG: efflux RND transporter periplasmic adaptor subunit [Thermodesulfobacteriota bacterium]
MVKSISNGEEEPRRSGAIAFVWRNLPRVILLFFFCLIVLLASTCSRQQKLLEQEKAAAIGEEKKPVNVVLLNLQAITMEDVINLPGEIEPWTRLELMAKVRGSVAQVLVREGDPVRKGDILARIEDDDFRIALDAATAVHRQARLDHERVQGLLKKKVQTQANLDLSLSRMQTARSEMDNAHLQLERCTIKAPMDGVVNRLDAKVGLLLSIGDPVAEILAVHRLKAVVGIPESDIAAVKQVENVELTIQALDERKVMGRSHYLSYAPETVARLYRMELELANEDGAILPGMFARANIVKQRVDGAVAVPLYAVITRNDEQYVFVAENGRVEKRAVTLGIIEGWQVQVRQGLAPGDRVLIEGHRDVDSGQQIKVVREVTDPKNILL